MKIMIVSHYLPPHVGGIEQVALAQASQLADAGHQVELVSTAVGAEPGDRESSGRSRARLRIHRLRAWNAVERRTGVPFPVPGPTALVAMLRRAARSDVVHVHDLLYPTSWLAAAAAVLTRTPLVLTQHVALVAHPSRLVRTVQQVVYASAGRAIVARAARIAYLNGAVADFLRTLGAVEQQLVFVPNGVDTEQFCPPRPGERAQLRTQFGLPAEDVLVLFAGRFVPKKGFDVTVAAADARYRLVLVGGHLPAAAQRVAEHPQITVLGPRSRAELAQLYRACDAFVLPSCSEGFPLTVAEAMASGMAVVTTDDPGYRPYQLDPTEITLIDPTSEGVRAALLQLSSDPERRLAAGERARAYAVRQFAPDRLLARLLDCYRAALRPSDPSAPLDQPDTTATGQEVHHAAA